MRFFAALAVVLCHVGYQFTNTSSVNVAESYGYIGVSFFFVLSGLVLTWSY
jgi:peptidoglycan/LPS O-acetylase OafA/YrhL